MAENKSEENAIKAIGWKIFPWVADALCAMLCYYAFQFNVELKEIRRDITEIREWKAETIGGQWTASDHAKYAQQQAEEFSKMWNKLAEIQQVWLRDISEIRIQLAQLPKKDDTPPQWFREYVKNIEIKLDKHIDEDDGKFKKITPNG